MRKITLHIHRVAGSNFDGSPNLGKVLPPLLATCGVELTVQPAPQIFDDPERREQYLEALDYKNLPNELNDPAHLILGNSGHSQDFGDALGALLDTDRRGVAAVFTHASQLEADNEDLFTQVCAHEIGHILNLIHSDCTPMSPTAMCQTRFRSDGVPSQAWQHRGLVPPPELTVEAFPFSAQAHGFVETAAERDLLPWGAPFRDGDPTDQLSNDLELELLPDADRWAVGGHFAFIVSVRNRSRSPLRVPAFLRPELGTLELRVTPPSGKRYFYRPASYAALEAEDVLKPGERRMHPQLLLRGPGYRLLPEPGRYRIEAWVPDMPAGSAGLEFDVATPEDGDPPSLAFSRFLIDGVPRRRWRQRKILNALLRSRDPRREPFVAHLAYLKARELKDLPMCTELLDAVEGSKAAPRALRHAAALERCWRARRDPATFRELRDERCDFFSETLDQTLQRSFDIVEQQMEGASQ